MSTTFAARRVLITGAAGAIGSVLRQGLRGRYELLRLSDVKPQTDAGAGEEIVSADIRDLDATFATMAGIDCVVHLAGIPVEAAWERILEANIVGCYNVFEAARRAGVKRVVFASSNHVIGFHRRETPMTGDSLPRPDSRYGVSKCFGEALGRLYTDKHGMSVACLRIGSFRARPEDERQLMTWISHGDMVRLAARCIDHPDYGFAVVYGVSNNDRNVWDNSHVAWLGYEPEDNAEDYAGEILARGEAVTPIAGLCHGGPFCADEFSAPADPLP